MKDIDNMGIGESFYLKQTVATISTRTGKPCEFDEERININDLIIKELEKLKAEFEEDKYILLNQTTAIKVIDNRITQLKGE